MLLPPHAASSSALESTPTTAPAPAQVAMYVYSGGQYGAHIELASGRWLVGSDDACDIILHDAAPRHATIEVTDSSDVEVALRLYPLDGGVRIAGGEEVVASSVDASSGAQACVTPSAGEAFFLGSLCLAWVAASAPRPDIALAQALQQEAEAATQAREEGAKASAQAADGEVSADAAAATPPTSGDATNVGSDVPSASGNGVGRDAVFDPHKMYGAPAARAGSPVLRFLLLGLAALLLIVLSVAITPVEKNIEQSKDDIVAALQTMGIADVQVNVLDKGIELRGTVPDEQAMMRVQELARSLQFPVYIEVGVQEDVLRAVRRSLGIRGYQPAVSIVGQGPAKRMRIAAYMKDTALEQAAFTALESEVKGLPPLEKHIVHERELAPVLSGALQRAGLGAVQAVYLAGRVDFSGGMAAKDALASVRQAVEAQMGVPLAGSVDSGAGRTISAKLTPAAPQDTSLSQGRAAAEPVVTEGGRAPLEGVRVTGVTMSPMRFVTAADGNRYFEGAVLPSGYTLRNINTKQLVLQLGDSIVTHTLRGTE